MIPKLDRKMIPRSAVSVILECEAREPHTPAGRVRLASLTILPRRFFTRSSLSFEYGPSLAFAKNTAVLQSIPRPVDMFCRLRVEI